MINFVENDLEFNEDTKKCLKKIFKHTLKLEEQKSRKIEVYVDFVTDEEMQTLNNETRKIDETTDVLSFPNLENVFNKKINKKTYPMDVNPHTKRVLLGDIVINVIKAGEQAKEYGHSTKREICYLFVHGLLHLFGYDHIDELDKKLMRAQEETILKKFKLKRD